MGKRAVNDPAESSFAGTTQQLQCFGRVGLTNAGGVDQVKRNGDFNRITLVKKGKTVVQQKLGFFHRLPEEMRISLLYMTKEYAAKTRKYDNDALEAQRAEKRRKEELMKDNNKKKASESFIDALYYHEMYFSPACWKTENIVDRELQKLKSKSAKLYALKENIRIRVIGLGWSEFSMTWSKDGKEKSIYAWLII